MAQRVFSRRRTVPFLGGLGRFARLLDGHVTLASMSILVAVGGWVPLLVNAQSAHDIAAHRLPDIVSSIQQVALIGLIITVFLSFKMLPPRPERYKRHRTIGMLLQWALMPVTAIVYSSAAAFNAQTHLFLGKYLDKFDVTEKATHRSVARAGATSLRRWWTATGPTLRAAPGSRYGRCHAVQSAGSRRVWPPSGAKAQCLPSSPG